MPEEEKKYQKNRYQNLSEEKNYCNILLKILKENNELKSAEVDLVPSFIKDKRESFLMLTFMVMMALKNLRSLNLDTLYQIDYVFE